MNTGHAERIKRLNAQSVPPPKVEDHIAHSIQKLIVPYFVDLLKLEVECRADRNIDSLRRFRITTIKLLDLFDLLDAYLTPKASSRFQKRLKKLLKRIDNVYKLDLMMRDLLVHGEGAENRMAVAGVIAHLDAQRLLSRDRLMRYLNSKKYYKFLKRFEKMLVSSYDDVFNVEDANLTDPYQVRHVLSILIFERVAKVRAYEVHIPNGDVQLLADMSDAVIRLHCVLETFKPVLDQSVQTYLDELDTLGNHLEKIAELDHVLDLLIHMPRVNFNPSQILSMKNYRRYLQNRRETLHNNFPAQWDAFSRREVKHLLANVVTCL